jgi:DNA invertase Pin-like site-specific DNA recombinase
MNPLPISDPTLAVTYRRVSSADQRDHGYGLDAQSTAVREFVRRAGLSVVGEFSDPGVSGTVPLEDRPGLSAALDAVLRTGAGALVVARHDRLARDTLQALLIERAFANARSRILYADGSNGESDTDHFTRTVLHAAAEQAKRETVRRLRAGREAKRERNPAAYVGGRPAFGYRADPETRELGVDPDAAGVVRAIFKMARRGESVRSISARLDAERAGDRRWHPTAVARVLAHEPYKLARPGRIVDPKVFNAAQRALAARRRRATRRP